MNRVKIDIGQRSEYSALPCLEENLRMLQVEALVLHSNLPNKDQHRQRLHQRLKHKKWFQIQKMTIYHFNNPFPWKLLSREFFNFALPFAV